LQDPKPMPHETQKDFDRLNRDIINVGLCTGCGTCVGVCPLGSVHMAYEEDEPIPQLSGKCTACGICYDVCPGRDIPMPELDSVTFGRKRSESEQSLGIYRTCLKGFATNENVRKASSSGGATSAIFSYAFDEGIIDGAIIAAPFDDPPWRFRPCIVKSAGEFVSRKSNSAYVMVPVNELLYEAVAKQRLRKLGIVGCPCHIHGLRKMIMQGKPVNIAKSIHFMVGLFCAANYYGAGTKHLIAEIGNVGLDEVSEIDYRGGDWPGYLTVKRKDNKVVTVSSKHDYIWHFLGASSYKRDRCLMCIDFAAELADISVGDSFITEPGADPRVTAMLIRTERGEELVRRAVETGYLKTQSHDPNLIPRSGLGWEAKKHANVHRLLQRQRFGWPAPDFGYVPSCTIFPRQLVLR